MTVGVHFLDFSYPRNIGMDNKLVTYANIIINMRRVVGFPINRFVFIILNLKT